MVSMLENSTLIEQCSVICFLLAEGKKPVNISCRMFKVYGKGSMNHANFYRWAEQLENDCNSVTCEQESGGKVMLIVFWDAKIPVFCDRLEEKQ